MENRMMFFLTLICFGLLCCFFQEQNISTVKTKVIFQYHITIDARVRKRKQRYCSIWYPYCSTCPSSMEAVVRTCSDGAELITSLQPLASASGFWHAVFSAELMQDFMGGVGAVTLSNATCELAVLWSSGSWLESRLWGSVWSLSLGGSSKPESCGLWERGSVLGGELTELGGLWPSSIVSTGAGDSSCAPDELLLICLSYWAMKSGSAARSCSSKRLFSLSAQFPYQSWNSLTW